MLYFRAKENAKGNYLSKVAFCDVLGCPYLLLSIKDCTLGPIDLRGSSSALGEITLGPLLNLVTLCVLIFLTSFFNYLPLKQKLNVSIFNLNVSNVSNFTFSVSFCKCLTIVKGKKKYWWHNRERGWYTTKQVMYSCFVCYSWTKIVIVSIEGCADYVEGSTTRWEIKNTSWKTKTEIGRCFKIRLLKQLSERESHAGNCSV